MYFIVIWYSIQFSWLDLINLIIKMAVQNNMQNECNFFWSCWSKNVFTELFCDIFCTFVWICMNWFFDFLLIWLLFLTKSVKNAPFLTKNSLKFRCFDCFTEKSTDLSKKQLYEKIKGYHRFLQHYQKIITTFTEYCFQIQSNQKKLLSKSEISRHNKAIYEQFKFAYI